MACVVAASVAPPALALAPPSNPHVTFDRHSLKIDGRAHLPQLRRGAPVPHAARGRGRRCSTHEGRRAQRDLDLHPVVSCHEPAPGRFRFDGRWDLERFLALRARPPASTSSCGPAPTCRARSTAAATRRGCSARPGSVRTEDPNWTAAVEAWYADVLPRDRALAGRRRAARHGRSPCRSRTSSRATADDGRDVHARPRTRTREAHGITVPIIAQRRHSSSASQPSRGLFVDDRRPLRVRQLPVRVRVLQRSGTTADVRAGRRVRVALPRERGRPARRSTRPRSRAAPRRSPATTARRWQERYATFVGLRAGPAALAARPGRDVVNRT